jgi:hypothetical protein
VRISLDGSPLFAAPASRSLAGAYFQATFETLFRQLVSPHTRVTTPGEASAGQEEGAHGTEAACAFELDWHR